MTPDKTSYSWTTRFAKVRRVPINAAYLDLSIVDTVLEDFDKSDWEIFSVVPLNQDVVLVVARRPI